MRWRAAACGVAISALACAVPAPVAGSAPRASGHLAPQVSSPTTPLVYTKFALTGGRVGDEGVWEMQADGADPRQLFPFAAPGAASLSPDGTEIAVARSGGDVVTMFDLSGTAVGHFPVLDPTGRGINSLSWSPSGEELAYSVVGEDGDLVAYTVGIDGQHPRELSDPGGNPSWSPGGDAVVVDNAGWYSGSTDGGLFIVTPGGGPREIVSQPGSAGAPAQPAWSPSGSTIAFDGRDGLSLVGSGGGPVHTLGLPGDAPVWWPDSAGVAYAQTLNGDTVSIFTAGVDGGGDRDVDRGNAGFSDTPVGFLPMPAAQVRHTCADQLPGGVVGMAPAPTGAGYWVADRGGDVVACGDAVWRGALSGVALSAAVVGIAADPETGGYWLAAGDGGVFAFDAPFFGSAGAWRLRAPVVGMAAAPGGRGYWLVAADGGVFAFGDARFWGSMGGRPLAEPVVAIVPGGLRGYRLVAGDGGVFAFGAAFRGALAGRELRAAVVAGGGAVGAGGDGYLLGGADGGVFSFDAPFRGSAAGSRLAGPVVGMSLDPLTDGYWLVAADGGVFSFGAPFEGSVAAA